MKLAECRCLSVDRSARLQIGVVGRIVSENLLELEDEPQQAVGTPGDLHG